MGGEAEHREGGKVIGSAVPFVARPGVPRVPSPQEVHESIALREINTDLIEFKPSDNPSA